MAIQLQLRRGTTAENDAFTGAVGEVTVDTGSKTLRIHDGTTVGGNRDYYSYTTNCITQTPQDIQLELSGGTLTLKAGSKVYVPNGSGVFDDIPTPADKTMFDSSITYNGKVLVCYNSNNNSLVGARIGGTNTIGSGTIANRPAASSMSFGAGLYYATDENKLYMGNKSQNTWTAGASLPIAIVSVTSGVGCVSIDQVFNGFGYIGSTVFGLPGVKALVPFYSNSDGSLKNSAPVSSSVNVYNVSTPVNDHKYSLAFNGTLVPFYNNLVYNEQENRNYAGGNATAWADIGYIYFSGGQISRFFVKQPFHAVDYSDTEFIAHQAMPSDKYIDLSSGITSGQSFTAPADGYAYFGALSTATNQRVLIYSLQNLFGSGQWSSNDSQPLKAVLPIRKGDVYTVVFTATDSPVLRFYYAQGSK